MSFDQIARRSDLTTRPSRRRVLHAGGGLLAWLGLSRLAGAAAVGVGQGRPRAKHCILVYLLGGPPHLDMWDPKPEAPAEIRGPFESIATSVPGVRFGEHLPLLARRADRFAIVRSDEPRQ